MTRSGFTGHIQCNRLNLVTILQKQVLQVFRISSGCNNLVALRERRFRNRTPQTSGGPGHQPNLACRAIYERASTTHGVPPLRRHRVATREPTATAWIYTMLGASPPRRLLNALSRQDRV